MVVKTSVGVLVSWLMHGPWVCSVVRRSEAEVRLCMQLRCRQLCSWFGTNVLGLIVHAAVIDMSGTSFCKFTKLASRDTRAFRTRHQISCRRCPNRVDKFVFDAAEPESKSGCDDVVGL